MGWFAKGKVSLRTLLFLISLTTCSIKCNYSSAQQWECGNSREEVMTQFFFSLKYFSTAVINSIQVNLKKKKISCVLALFRSLLFTALPLGLFIDGFVLFLHFWCIFVEMLFAIKLKAASGEEMFSCTTVLLYSSFLVVLLQS